MVTIEEVKTKKQVKLFTNFPLKLYKNCEFYVPPTISDEMNIFDIKKNSNLRICEIVGYLAYKDGELAGRIAGILQNDCNKITNKKRVRISRVDFIDDIEVAKALFDSVENWAISKNMNEVHGPLGFNDLEREGLLIDGFDQLSTFEENYNFAYYKDYFEKLGYQKDVDWFEYKIKIPKQINPKLKRISDIVSRKYNLKVVDIKNKWKMIDQYKNKIFDLLNECYGPLYGVVPLTKEIENQLIFQFKLIVNPRYMALVVNEQNELVGFGLTFPNIANGMKATKGKFFSLYTYKLLKNIFKPKVVDLALVGVKTEYRTKGVSSLIFNKIISNYIEDKIEYAESNLQLEYNKTIQNQFTDFEYELHKKRRCYIKKLVTKSDKQIIANNKKIKNK